MKKLRVICITQYDGAGRNSLCIKEVTKNREDWDFEKFEIDTIKIEKKLAEKVKIFIGSKRIN